MYNVTVICYIQCILIFYSYGLFKEDLKLLASMLAKAAGIGVYIHTCMHVYVL